MPKVSILLPNYNNFSFLRERFETIFNQTFSDWELIVLDSYSNDGSWELIQQFANQDSRIRISQAAREGVYAGLNRCINLASGEYIYIAPGDDTMTPDCLKKMVAALEKHKECDLCHCCLTVIDESGEAIKDNWNTWEKATFFRNLISQEHIRFAPYDGILYCALGTVYTSLTEILIRKIVFDEAGLFKTDFGSHGDFEWGLRVSLLYNTIHIPYYLATWRIHANQATQNSFIFSAKGQDLWCQMIESAFESVNEKSEGFSNKFDLNALTFCYRFQQLKAEMAENKNYFAKLKFLIKYASYRFDVAIRYLFLWGVKQSFNHSHFIRRLITKLGYEENIKVV